MEACFEICVACADSDCDCGDCCDDTGDDNSESPSTFYLDDTKLIETWKPVAACVHLEAAADARVAKKSNIVALQWDKTEETSRCSRQEIWQRDEIIILLWGCGDGHSGRFRTLVWYNTNRQRRRICRK
ncbi:hypothetical protein BDZ89DRAFT_333290 [Hymenopellis radicata]|nr:hypothetical protein BDZ89DRAFT_333290 [Hymenopellis radicata]